MEKLVPDPFIHKLNWAYYMINSLKCYWIFLLYAQVVVYKNNKTKVLITWFYLIYDLLYARLNSHYEVWSYKKKKHKKIKRYKDT